MMTKNTITFLIWCLVLTGCSGMEREDLSKQVPEQVQNLENVTIHSSEEEPEYDIELIRELAIVDNKQVYFGTPQFVEADDSGRLFIANGLATGIPKVRIFDSDGYYLGSLGRSGRGPGEFLSVNNLMFHSGALYVFDGRLLLVHTFSLETLEYEDTIYLHPQNRDDFDEMKVVSNIYPLKVQGDGTFLVRYTEFPSVGAMSSMGTDASSEEGYRWYFNLSADGSRLTNLIFEEEYTSIMPGFNSAPEPFENAPLFAHSEDGKFYTAWSKDFLIRAYDAEGNYLRAFYHPFEKRPLTRDEAREIVVENAVNASDEREEREKLNQVTLPETWPVLHSMEVDDENLLWISTIVDSDEIYRWWIVDSRGALLARFDWPRDREIMEIKNGYMYARETDESGVASVVKYRIEMSER